MGADAKEDRTVSDRVLATYRLLPEAACCSQVGKNQDKRFQSGETLLRHGRDSVNSNKVHTAPAAKSSFFKESLLMESWRLGERLAVEESGDSAR
jgi:hypothetical protein